MPASNEPVMNKIPKSSSVNSNMNFKVTFDELENHNMALLNNLQQK